MTNDVDANGHTVRKINFGPGPAQLPVEVCFAIYSSFFLQISIG